MASTLSSVLVFASFTIGEMIFILPRFYADWGYFFGNLEIVILGFTSIILYTGIIEACSKSDFYNYGKLLNLYFGESCAKFGLIAIAIKYTYRSMSWLSDCIDIAFSVIIFINPSLSLGDSIEFYLILLTFSLLVAFSHYQAAKVNQIMKLRYLSYFILFSWIYLIVLSIVWPPINRFDGLDKRNDEYDNFLYSWLFFGIFIMDTSSIQWFQ